MMGAVQDQIVLPELAPDETFPQPTPAVIPLTEQQVIDFIAPMLPAESRIQAVRHLNQLNYNIAVEVWTTEVITISQSILDDAVWWDGVTDFSRRYGNVLQDGYFVAGDDTLENRLITLWVIPEVVRQSLP